MKNFKFRNQIPRLSDADVLGALIEKFLVPEINLSPYPVERHPGIFTSRNRCAPAAKSAPTS